MRDSEIAQHILQIMQIDKSCLTVWLPGSHDSFLRLTPQDVITTRFILYHDGSSALDKIVFSRGYGEVWNVL